MHIDWWTLGLQTVNLLALIWLLGRFLFRPLARIVADRQAEANRMIDDAAATREQAKATQKSAEEEKARTIAARDGVLAQAGKEAEAQRAKLMDDARKEADDLLLSANAEMARDKQNQRDELEKQAGALAVDISARLLQGSGANLPLSGFETRLEQALAGLPEPALASLDNLTLHSAKELEPEERSQLKDLIAKSLGHPVKLEFSVTPDLIAGFRMTGDMVEVDASLRADLDRLRSELGSHDERD